MNFDLDWRLRLTDLLRAFCCVRHGTEVWLYTGHRNSNELASLTLCECIFGRHVCNYSVNTELGSVLFSFFFPRTYGIMPPCNSLLCLRKLQSWERPRLCVHAHTRTHTLSCVLLCYSQLCLWIDCFVWVRWIHRELQSCKLGAVSWQFNVCHHGFHLFLFRFGPAWFWTVEMRPT